MNKRNNQLMIIVAGAMLISTLTLSSPLPAFAQVAEPRAALKEGHDIGPRLNTTDADIPMLEKISDKGIYTVQLRWAQVPLNPENAFAVQLFFLDAASPTATLPQTESNATGSGTEAAFTAPDIVASLLPVESYDMTIYSEEGNILWQKLNQPGEGGRPGHRIELADDYRGPVRIEITDIKPGWNVDDEADITDSVTFNAVTIVQPALAQDSINNDSEIAADETKIGQPLPLPENDTGVLRGEIGSVQSAHQGIFSWSTSGNWVIQFSNTTEQIESFNATIHMVRLDGSLLHKHEVYNFSQSSVSYIGNGSIVYEGTMTVTMREGPVETVPGYIHLLGNSIAIWVDPRTLDNHFGQTPIRGMTLPEQEVAGAIS